MIDAFAMHAPPPRTVPQCRLVWLLWLALLLPIAQVTATWHALSHTGVATVDAAVASRLLTLPIATCA